MKKQYISVREFAQLSGRSKQTIYKQLSTKLSTYSTKVDNQTMIDISALSEVYGITGSQPSCQPIQPNESTQSQPELTTSGESQNLQQVIDILREQLSTKDEQIKALNERIKTLDEERLILEQLVGREQQLRLVESAPESAENVENVPEKESVLSSAAEPKTPGISGLFKRVFGR